MVRNSLIERIKGDLETFHARLPQTIISMRHPAEEGEQQGI